MPTLNVDRPFKTDKPKLADYLGPIEIAKSRSAVKTPLVRSVDSKLLNDVPLDGGALSVHVEDLVAPLAQLRQRVNQLHHLVARLPFKTDRVTR